MAVDALHCVPDIGIWSSRQTIQAGPTWRSEPWRDKSSVGQLAKRHLSTDAVWLSPSKATTTTIHVWQRRDNEHLYE